MNRNTIETICFQSLHIADSRRCDFLKEIDWLYAQLFIPYKNIKLNAQLLYCTGLKYWVFWGSRGREYEHETRLRCANLAASYQCFGTEDRGSSFLQNTGNLVPDHTASRPRRQ